PVTLRKEIASLRACWNWATHSGLLTGSFPNRGLRFPKCQEKPPFQTREAIERIIARGGLDDPAQKALWDCLFLGVTEIHELLEHVRLTASHAWIYPMIFTAAHTGMAVLRGRADVGAEASTLNSRQVQPSEPSQGQMRTGLYSGPYRSCN